MLKLNKLPNHIKNKIKNKIKEKQITNSNILVNKKPKNMPEFIIHNNEHYVSFTLFTRAIPKGRPRLVVNEKQLLKALSLGIKGIAVAKNSFNIITPKTTKEYESWIAYCGLQAMQNKQIIDSFFSIDVIISNDKQFSDIDNCLKSIMDGLNKITYKDDKSVRKGTILFIEKEPMITVNIDLMN